MIQAVSAVFGTYLRQRRAQKDIRKAKKLIRKAEREKDSFGAMLLLVNKSVI